MARWMRLREAVAELLRPLAEGKVGCPGFVVRWLGGGGPHNTDHSAEHCDCHGTGKVPDPRFEALRRKTLGGEVLHEALYWGDRSGDGPTAIDASIEAILDAAADCGLETYQAWRDKDGWHWRFNSGYDDDDRPLRVTPGDGPTAPEAAAKALVAAVGA